MNQYNFSAASKGEKTVFGAERPGYGTESVGVQAVQEWIRFMKKQSIEFVCCLLPHTQLRYFTCNLLKKYTQEFGVDNVCWAPIADFYLCKTTILHTQILPFLENAESQGKAAVVHCSAGIGRTGQVLAAWLVYKRSFSVNQAIASVQSMGRDPFEAVYCRNVTKEMLYELLQQ